MRFAIFPLHLSKVLRLPRKIDARPYEVLHLSRKIILANRQIRCSKMQPVSGNQRPDLLTSMMNMFFVLRLPREMHLCRSSSNVLRLPSFLEMLQNPHVLLRSGARILKICAFVLRFRSSECTACVYHSFECTFGPTVARSVFQFHSKKGLLGALVLRPLSLGRSLMDQLSFRFTFTFFCMYRMRLSLF